MVKQYGGGFDGGREHGAATIGGAGQTGGKRLRRRSGRRTVRKTRRTRKTVKRGGEGVIAAAAVPFGLLALQRYFKGSKSSKKGVRNIGSSFKRTFRRRH